MNNILVGNLGPGVTEQDIRSAFEKHGTVARFKMMTDHGTGLSRGFGFIDTGSSKDLFFHSSSVQGVGFEALQEGQKVSYTEGRGPKGPCAENVKSL